MDPRERLIVALDLTSRDDILSMVEELRGSVGVFKLGLQAFVANGPSIVREVVASGDRVFLDLKFHDIPNTAMRAVGEAAALAVSMTTVHAAGGRAMMQACAGAAGEALLLGVTVLTSLASADLDEIGLDGSPLDAAVRLAVLATRSGCGGVVASPHEIEAIREACGSAPAVVTPGIRPADAAAGDQQRIMTPREAIRRGASHIVVGRPIVTAVRRREAALRIVDEIASAIR